MRPTDVLIVGAGIAGCTTAYWLREFGFTPTVVERAPAPRSGGQTVDLRGAGRVIVDRMGLLDTVRQHTVAQRGIAWVDSAGQRRAEQPVEAFGGRGIISTDEILRGDLARLLQQAAATGVDYVWGDWVTALVPGRDRVDVRFANSAPRRFSLVVGADGVNSGIRELVFGERTGLRPLGVLNAWFTVPAEVDLAGWFLMHHAPGGRMAALRPGRVPGEQQAALAVRTDETPDRRGLDAQRAQLARHFAGVGWESARLLAAARDTDDLYMHQMCQVRLPSWSAERVVLVGDAGCCPSPLTGLGTSLALVGAYVLAGELAAAGPAAPAAALTRYEQVLRPYVTRAQQLPPGIIDGYVPRSSARIRLGWAAMRWATRWPMRAVMERAFAAADAIALPNYPTPVG